MAAKSPASKKKSAKVSKSSLKSPKTPKTDKVAAKSKKIEKDAKKNLFQTTLNSTLVEKAVQALVKYHEKTTADNMSLLGNDRPIQVQFTLLRKPDQAMHKPVRIMIPHPLYKVKTDDDSNGSDVDDDGLEEPEICLIVKEESKPWCQEIIEKFPEHMGCVKKVLGLQSLRKKHARFEQRRELLNKYNFFMADDRILPMLSKALGKDFFKAKKLPIPVTLTRKEALPFTIQKALRATYMSVSAGTCVMVRAGNTSMSAKHLSENVMEIAANAVPKLPLKWANVLEISVKTPDSMALPVYNKTPEVLSELATMAGITEDVDLPEKEADEKTNSLKKEKKTDKDNSKKRELKSPLVRALKKQKQEEKGKKSKEGEIAKTKKKQQIEQVKEKNVDAGKTQAKKGNDSNENPEKKEFIATKKFKGSKEGYVFKMGKQGLGYYIDVKPVVDRMAMEAFLRTAKNQSRRGGQKKNKHRGTRRF